MMKKADEKVKGVLCFPIVESTEKKIGDVNKLEAAVIQNGVVFMKSEMTALEVVETITELKNIAEELFVTLAKSAGICGESECPYECVYETEAAVDIKLPQFLLEDANIPKDAKLCAYTNSESGEIVVMEAEYKHDLSDIPKEMVQTLKEIGICICELNRLIMSEQIIYKKNGSEVSSK